MVNERQRQDRFLIKKAFIGDTSMKQLTSSEPLAEISCCEHLV